MTNTILKAQRGSAHSMRLDAKAKEQLKHLRLFIATKMNLQVSDSVIIRRALNMLIDEYEKLIRSTWIKGKEHMVDNERLNLSSASSGSHDFSLEPIAILNKFPTWQQRVDAIKKPCVMDILEEQEVKRKDEKKSFYKAIGQPK